MEAVEHSPSPTGPGIEIAEEDGRVGYEGLTLLAPPDGRPLLKDLSVTIPSGIRVLIAGPNVAAKVALFRATAGIWTSGEGRIVRPGADGMLWLAERPYLPPGTLRELLVRAGQDRVITDDRILSLLRELNLEPVLARVGGLDREQDWDAMLSLGEQQLLAFLQILLAAPRFVFLDRPGTALSSEQVGQMLKRLSDNSISYLTVGEAGESLNGYDAVLNIADAGGWTWKTIKAGQIEE